MLAKGNELVAVGKLDDAYDYYRFLFDKQPRLPGLEQGFENYLFEEAKFSHRAKKYDDSLAVLRQLFARNPKWPGLDKAMGAETEKLVEQYAAQRRYAAARVLIEELNRDVPRPHGRRGVDREVPQSGRNALPRRASREGKGRLVEGRRLLPR